MEGSAMTIPGAAHTASAQQHQQQLVDQQLQVLGLPQLPFDKREIDAQIAREREDHAAYIYEFRTRVCEAYLNGNCPNDSYTCFQTHARLPRRRSDTERRFAGARFAAGSSCLLTQAYALLLYSKPILQHGRFNYIPTRWQVHTHNERGARNGVGIEC